jgi:hypothetical protein
MTTRGLTHAAPQITRSVLLLRVVGLLHVEKRYDSGFRITVTNDNNPFKFNGELFLSYLRPLSYAFLSFIPLMTIIYTHF